MSAARPKASKTVQGERQRALQREKDVARAQTRQTARRKRIVLVGGGILLAALAMVAALYYALNSTATVSTAAVAADLGSPTSAAASPPANGFTKVGPPLYQGGKPELLFIGAQYCPHCAGQRWSIIKALNQFGTFSNLTSSSSSEGNIPTFDLTQSTYTSPLIAFDHKDVEDRNHQPLQSLDAAEQSAFNKYDPSGGIPLVFAGGYAIVGDAYNLTDLDGKSFQSVQQAMQRGDSSPIVGDINAEANAITAFLCHVDGMRPSSVCGRSVIRSIVQTLR